MFASSSSAESWAVELVETPTSSRSTFAWVSGSRDPAPTPIALTVIAG
jgi:hypothetical protein